uniref:Uncharacterized protein n=1 Tax=Anguilla anguilla TaxID=7936 RepID=A0A0E9VAG3_ANGAN
MCARACIICRTIFEDDRQKMFYDYGQIMFS